MFSVFAVMPGEHLWRANQLTRVIQADFSQPEGGQ